jgi:uncharacterized protein YdeI (YjbR/CyaY-like superfamily)
VGRQIRFTALKQITDIVPILKAYVYEAIEMEKSGLKVPVTKKAALEYPEEFQNKLVSMPKLKTAFEALTPGRQRAYIYHFSEAKQSKTRESRIEKWIPQILKGKGLAD